MHDPQTNKVDAIMQKLNEQQALDYPGDDTRLDKYTFAQALHYLEKYQPRFLWISLGDSDVYAHEENLVGYHQSLAYYDQTLDQLMNTLKSMHIDKETMVIVTTDHGRGNKHNWINHGEEFPESKQTWAFVLNGQLTPVAKQGSVSHYSTLSIRPTVEKIFGL